MCLLAVCVIGSYELVRSASSGLLLETHGAEGLGRVWLIVALATGATVVVYNRVFGGHHRLWVLTVVAAGSALAIALLAQPAAQEKAWATAAIFILKDIYIVVLVETFWSHANVNYPIKSARWLYGLFLFCGSLGGALGSASVSWASGANIALESVLGWAPPVLGIAAALAWWGYKDEPAFAAAKEHVALGEGFRRVAQSRYLLSLLGIVIASQVVLTLLDFQFQERMALEVKDAGSKAGSFADIFLIINVAAMTAQVFSGFALKGLGVPRVLLAICWLVGLAWLLSVIQPTLWMAAGALVVAKVLDYSWSKAAKELCYIPLSVADKTLGKPVIDMFAYRFAKGFASIQLMGAVALAAWAPAAVTIVALSAWAFFAWKLGTRFSRKTAEPA